MPNHGYALALRVWLDLLGAQLADSSEERDKYLKDADACVGELERKSPSYILALQPRVGYFDNKDDIQTLLRLEESILPGDTLSTYVIAAAKYRHALRDEARRMFQNARGSKRAFLLMGRAATLAFTEDCDSEIQDLYREFKTLHPHKWFVPEALLLMQSDDRFRQQQCHQRLSTSNDNTDEWYKAVLQYIADDGTNEEEARRRLQRAPREIQRKCKSTHEYMLFALKSLRQNERFRAVADLEDCVAEGHYIASLWARAYLRRLQDDPTWLDVPPKSTAE